MDEYRQSLVGRALADVLQELEGSGRIDARAGDTLFALFDAAVRDEFSTHTPRGLTRDATEREDVDERQQQSPPPPRVFTHASMELRARVESYNRFMDKWSVVAALDAGGDRSAVVLDKAAVALPSPSPSAAKMLVKLHRAPPPPNPAATSFLAHATHTL